MVDKLRGQRPDAIKIKYGFGKVGFERTIMELPDGMGRINYGGRPPGVEINTGSSVLPNDLTRLDLRDAENQVTLEGPITNGTTLEMPLSNTGYGETKIGRGKRIIIYAGGIQASAIAQKTERKPRRESILFSTGKLTSENGNTRGDFTG